MTCLVIPILSLLRSLHSLSIFLNLLQKENYLRCEQWREHKCTCTTSTKLSSCERVRRSMVNIVPQVSSKVCFRKVPIFTFISRFIICHAPSNLSVVKNRVCNWGFFIIWYHNPSLCEMHSGVWKVIIRKWDCTSSCTCVKSLNANPPMRWKEDDGDFIKRKRVDL